MVTMMSENNVPEPSSTSPNSDPPMTIKPPPITPTDKARAWYWVKVFLVVEIVLLTLYFGLMKDWALTVAWGVLFAFLYNLSLFVVGRWMVHPILFAFSLIRVVCLGYLFYMVTGFDRHKVLLVFAGFLGYLCYLTIAYLWDSFGKKNPQSKNADTDLRDVKQEHQR